MATCQTKPEHADGFRGTKPDRLNTAVNCVLPRLSEHFIGSADCIRAIRSKKFKAYIILYSGFHKNKKQYYHYTFTFKAETKDPSLPVIFISQNDGSEMESPWSQSEFVKKHFSAEGTVPVLYPQVWAIA
jgi:hypothetical protein